MDFSLRRVNAIFIKEFRDFFRNPNVLIMCMLPIMFALLYGKMMGNQIPKSMSLTLCLLMSLTMIGCLVAAMLIAEEKEKNTLRTLMLSPLSPIEFLTGKALVTVFLCMVTNIIIFILVKPPVINIFEYTLIALFSTIAMVFLGALVGLLSRNQMETGIVGFPIYMILLLIPILSHINPVMQKIANLCFTYHTLEAIDKLSRGQGLSAIKFNVLVIFIWLIISLILFILACRRVKLDK